MNICIVFPDSKGEWVERRKFPCSCYQHVSHFMVALLEWVGMCGVAALVACFQLHEADVLYRLC